MSTRKVSTIKPTSKLLADEQMRSDLCQMDPFAVVPENSGVNVATDAYSIARAAFELGASYMMKVMQHYENDMNVVWFGLWNLSKFEYEGNDDGTVTEDAEHVYSFTLNIMSDWQGHDPIQGMAISVLVTISDSYANRAFISTGNAWIDPIRKAVFNMKTTEYNPTRHKKNSSELEQFLLKFHGTISIATKGAISIANNTCIFLSKMAYDEDARITISEHGIPLVMHATRLCFEESSVIRNGCFAIYNFVHRNKSGHDQANTTGCQHFLYVLSKFLRDNVDDSVMHVISRALKALESGGWNADIV